jgi:hypothetical protein
VRLVRNNRPDYTVAARNVAPLQAGREARPAEEGIVNAPWWNGDEPDPHPDGRYEQPDLLTCDYCAGDAFTPVTGPLGAFCSRTCYDRAELQLNSRVLAKASGK